MLFPDSDGPPTAGLGSEVDFATRLQGLNELPVTERQALFFLTSARCGSFSRAARRLSIGSIVLRRALRQLEARMGNALFVHHGNLLVLSPFGQQLHAHLNALHDPWRRNALQKPVRLAVAKPLLQDLLSRELIAFLRRNAGCLLEVIAPDSLGDLQNVEAEVMVWLDAPSDNHCLPRFAISEPVLLATFDYLPHIAKRYAGELKRSTCVSDLEGYMLVQWTQHLEVGAFAPWNSLVEQRGAAMAQVDGYDLSCALVRSGACVGLLPDYSMQLDRNVTALPSLFSQPMQRNAWLAVHREAQGRADVESIVEFIQDAFKERWERF